MLQFKNVTLRRGRRVLFSDASFVVPRTAKLGIVGRNGTGKSSMLALLRGELQSDLGDVDVPTATVTAHVAQDIAQVDKAAIDYVIDGDQALRKIEQSLALAEQRDDGNQIAHFHGELGALDGYTARTRAAQLMHGLGFETGDDERSVVEFSGGWRMRLNLAQALMCPSDLLLLDEPTNHLDLEAVIWLERWLKSYTGTLLIIAHDQEFLESIVDHVLHLDGTSVQLYRGNYSQFERQRAAAGARHASLFEHQQREVKRIKSFVDRFRAKATKARQAQSRLKALDRMDLIVAAHADAPVHFEFPAAKTLPNPLVKFEDISVGYGTTTILGNVNFSLRPGMRIGLLGRNGAGKSTLIKMMAGELELSGGARESMPGLKTGYFAQHQLEALDPQASPLLHLRRIAGDTREQRLKDFLGGFDFGGERVDFESAQLSGGEKARLALALLIWQAPNLLLLDEPTNHLDLEMRHALNLALQGFDGALVLVSHDRHLLRTVTDELWLVNDGIVRPFRGDIDDYRNDSEEAVVERTPDPELSSPQPGADRKVQRRDQARKRARRQPLADRIKRLEANIEKATNAQRALDEGLADQSLYEPQNKDVLREKMFDRARLGTELEAMEVEWLAAQEQLDASDSAG